MRYEILRLPGTDFRRPRRSGIDVTPMYGGFVGRLIGKIGLLYEPEVVACILAFLDGPHPALFMDIGANVFYFPAIVRSYFSRDEVRICAFEPTPELCRIGGEVALKNDIEFEIIEKAVSDTDGELPFYLSARSDASNSLNAKFRKHCGTIRVKSITIDSFVEQRGILNLSGNIAPAQITCVLKIDTETTEPDVLVGAQRFIQAARPWIICEVLPGGTDTRLTDFFRANNYLFYSITEKGLLKQPQIVGDMTFRDWLFVPTKVDPEINARQVAWFAAISHLYRK